MKNVSDHNNPRADMLTRARCALDASCESVPSPCVNVCQIDAASGLCCGCRRTLPEIAAWQGLDDAAKRKLWHALLARSA